MKKSILFFTLNLWVIFQGFSQGFTTITDLSPVPVSTNTGEKPQSKVWAYEGKHWAVLPNSSGTHLYRLDGTTWTNILRLSTRTSSKADCKLVGNDAHILLFQGASSQFVSVEYNHATGSYQLWSKRTSTVGLNFQTNTQTATIDMDGIGRMWLAYDAGTEIQVRHSDSPYNNWSNPFIVANNVNIDDICTVVALPGKIGVFWSNQNTQRFGFRTHLDGASPTSWSTDEVPASQSALTIGKGMADDHMNMAVGMDGTLYAAVKTEYNTSGYPAIALLVRRPSGTWDDLYPVANSGTRPIVVLNEEQKKVRVVYTSQNGGGNIEYNESSLNIIAFSPQLRLINSSSLNNSTGAKDNFTTDVVILASNTTHAVGVLATDGTLSSYLLPPTLSSPANFYTNVSINSQLEWLASSGAETYHVQVSSMEDFSSFTFEKNGETGLSVNPSGLVNNTKYYWRVRASNSKETSDWSAIWSFTTKVASSGTTLIAHWQFDEGSGTTLNDASEYNNNATTSGGPTWIDGIKGKAIRFNGSNQFATVPDNASLDLTQSLTIATWIRPEKTATQYIVKKAVQGSIDGYELSLANNGRVFFRFNQHTSGDTYRLNSLSSHPANGNTWMHVAVTYDGTTMKMYLDGVENSSTTFNSPPPIATNELVLALGAEFNGFRSLQGGMDEVYIFNRALSASEIGVLADLSTEPTPLNPPGLVAPEDTAIGVSTTPTLNWNASEGAETYHAQVSTASDFSSTVFDQADNPQTSVAPNALENATTHYWRVRATNASGNSEWSATWSFTTTPEEPILASPPTLSSPSDNATDISTTPTLNWNASEGVKTYHAQVSTASNFSSMIFDQEGINATSVALNALENASTYYWRVRATNAAGNSEWSATWSFTTASVEQILPSPPTLSSPSNNATDISISPTLIWNATEGAATYHAQVSTASNFSATEFDQSGISQTFLSLNALENATTYYWRIRTTNAAGNSDWSTVWSFTTVQASQAGELIAHWKLDEGSGTTLNDASGFNNTASTTGNPVWVEGVQGLSLRLNGAGQFATAPDQSSLDIQESITIATWIRPERRSVQYLIHKSEPGGRNGYELFLANNGKVSFQINHTSSRVTSQASYPTNGRTWMHVAVTYEGTTLRLYINGVENSSSILSSQPIIGINQLPLTIGASQGGANGFMGAMDDIMIYNMALSPDQVRQIASLRSISSAAFRVAPDEFAESKEPRIEAELLAYPNPFAYKATITFTFPEETTYTITMYDSKGTSVTDLIKGEAKANERNNFEIDGEGLSAGVYLLRLQTWKGETKTLRLVLTK